MSRWRHNQVESTSQGHQANKWKNRDSNPSHLTLEPPLLTMKLYCFMKLYGIAAYSPFDYYVVFNIYKI